MLTEKTRATSGLFYIKNFTKTYIWEYDQILIFKTNQQEKRHEATNKHAGLVNFDLW